MKLRLVLPLMLFATSAMADDAGDGGDGGNAGDAGADAAPCDGGICDTTNGSSCNLGGSAAGSILPVLALLLAARRRRALLAMLAITGTAMADPDPVDVKIKDAPPERRFVSIEMNPLPMFTIGRFGGNVVVAPLDHHAIILSPFYATATTEPIFVYDDNGNGTQVPKQTFSGFGGELGYRYYTGLGGPRGFFLGPSFILGIFTASPMTGPGVHYLNLGGALDAGYQALIGDRVSLSLGGGLQFLGQDKSFPNQQTPAKFYANSGVLPRLLLSIGVAL